jgi:hypothetical protein
MMGFLGSFQRLTLFNEAGEIRLRRSPNNSNNFCQSTLNFLGKNRSHIRESILNFSCF